MKTLQLGVVNLLEFYREDPAVTMTEVKIIDTDDGSIIETIPVGDITNDDTIENPTVAINAGDYEFTALNLEKGRDYLIQPRFSYMGKAQRVSTIAVNITSNQGEIRHEFFNNYDTLASFKGILSTCEFTPSDELLNREVLIIWKDSNSKTYRSQAVLVKYKAQNPITHHHIIAKFPRLIALIPEWQIRSGVGYQPQSDEAFETVRTLMYRNGVILDRVADIDALKPLLWIQIERILSESGIDPSGRSDRDEAIKEFNKSAGRELKKCLALKLFVDNKETNTHQDQTISRSMHNSAYKRVGENWRNSL